MKRYNVTDEEREKIIRFRKKGLTINQISMLVDRSKFTVSEVCQEVAHPYAYRYKGVRKEIYMWLSKNWRWKPPKEQINLSGNYRIRKKRKPTQFRTPYSYPRLWEQERRSQ